MDKRNRKMVAPIVVTILTIVYQILYFSFIMYAVPGIWSLLFGIFPMAFAAVMIYVCIARYREIKKGEEDDLSQY